MLTIDLRSIFKLRGIQKPYTALVQAGISSQSAHKILSSQARIFRLDHIEIICKILNCTPNDLLRWTPDYNNTLHENHALNKLKHEGEDFQLQDTLKKMTLEQLNQIAGIINQQQEGK